MRASWLLLLLVLFPAQALCQDAGWKGKTIILKDGTVPFYSQEPGSPPALLGNLRHITYKVLDDKDGKLRVNQAGTEGWVEKEKVLPTEQALEHFTGALTRNPQVAYYYSRRAAIHRLQGDNAKALKDQDETIRLSPEEPAYWNNRGITHA